MQEGKTGVGKRKTGNGKRPEAESLHPLEFRPPEQEDDVAGASGEEQSDSPSFPVFRFPFPGFWRSAGMSAGPSGSSASDRAREAARRCEAAGLLAEADILYRLAASLELGDRASA